MALSRSRPVAPKHVVAVATMAVAASGLDGAGVRGGLGSVGAKATRITMARTAGGCAFAPGITDIMSFAMCGDAGDQRRQMPLIADSG